VSLHAGQLAHDLRQKYPKICPGGMQPAFVLTRKGNWNSFR